MASLYQRFTGKINTSRSFPAPPEASRLLGGQGPEEDGGPKPLGPQAQAVAPRERGSTGGRPRFQYQARSDCDEEDVSASRWVGGGGGFGRALARDAWAWRLWRFPCAPLRSSPCARRCSPELQDRQVLASRCRDCQELVLELVGFGATPAGIWDRLGMH